MEIPEGRIDFSLLNPGELPDGNWEIFDNANQPLYNGTWKTDPQTVCAIQDRRYDPIRCVNGN